MITLKKHNFFIIVLLVICLLFSSFLQPLQVDAIPIVAIPIVIELFAMALVSTGVVTYYKVNPDKFDNLWNDFKSFCENEKLLQKLIVEAEKEYIIALKNKTKMKCVNFANAFNLWSHKFYASAKFNLSNIASKLSIPNVDINDFGKYTLSADVDVSDDMFTNEFQSSAPSYNIGDEFLYYYDGIKISNDLYVGISPINDNNVTPIYYNSVTGEISEICGFCNYDKDNNTTTFDRVFISGSSALNEYKRNFYDEELEEDKEGRQFVGRVASNYHDDYGNRVKVHYTLNVANVNGKIAFYFNSITCDDYDYKTKKYKMANHVAYTSDLLGHDLASDFVPSAPSRLPSVYVPNDVGVDVAFPHTLGGLSVDNVRDLTAEQIYKRYKDGCNSVDVAHSIIDGALSDAKSLSIDFVDGVASEAVLENVIPVETSTGDLTDVLNRINAIDKNVDLVNGRVTDLSHDFDNVRDSVRDLPMLKDRVRGLTDTLDGLKSIPEFLLEKPNVSLNFDSFKDIKLYEKFPFSLPWDLRNSVKVFVKPGVAPKWETSIQNVPIVIDFARFESLALISRSFLFIIFCVVLIILTRKFLSW